MDDYLKRILDGFKSYNPSQDTALIEKAYNFAQKAHKGQKRLTGEDFFMHCCEVALILFEHKLDMDTIVESAKVLYGFLETLNTIQIGRKIDKAYLEEIF